MAQSLEQDTRESSDSPTMATQATNHDQEGFGKGENNEEPTKTGRQDEPEEMEVKAATVITPKEWRYLHNQWLHSIMWAAMGDKVHPDIPNLADYKYTPQTAPDYEIKVEPPRDHVIRYDLCIKVAVGENQVELFHQAFCKWYLKVKEAD